MARTGTAGGALAVTPNDGSGLGYITFGLYVGAAGNVKVDLRNDGTGITFVGVPAGTVLPIQVSKVYATGTTATNLIALF